MKRVETWNESVAAFKTENGVVGVKDAVATTLKNPSKREWGFAFNGFQR